MDRFCSSGPNALPRRLFVFLFFFCFPSCRIECQYAARLLPLRLLSDLRRLIMLLTSILNKPPAWDLLFVLFPCLKNIVSSLFYGKKLHHTKKKLILDHHLEGWESDSGMRGRGLGQKDRELIEPQPHDASFVIFFFFLCPLHPPLHPPPLHPVSCSPAKPSVISHSPVGAASKSAQLDRRHQSQPACRMDHL